MNWVSIPRPRLFKRFRDHAPITLIYGLPGSGKTHLLREWMRVQDIRAAWLTCCDADNDPVCFWHHLLHVFGPAISSTSLTTSPFPSNLEASMLYAWALVHGGELDQAERYLHHPTHSQTGVNAIRARIAAVRGQKQAMIHFSEKALEQMPETEFSLRADMLLNVGCAHLDGGHAAQAQRILTEALRLSRTAQQDRAGVFSYYFLGKVSIAQGRLQQALMQYQEGLDAYKSMPVAGVLHVGIAEIYYEHNDLNRAKQLLEDALHMGEQGKGEILHYVNHSRKLC